MSEKVNSEGGKDKTAFSRVIGAKADRKMKARRNPALGVWFGLGMMGLIGWSVVVPTLLGAALGLWMDNHYPGNHSYTLTIMVIGLCLGCINAWHWVTKEDKEIQGDEDNDHE